MYGRQNIMAATITTPDSATALGLYRSVKYPAKGRKIPVSIKVVPKAVANIPLFQSGKSSSIGFKKTPNEKLAPATPNTTKELDSTTHHP